MVQSSIFSVISPIMVGPSSSHTAGAVRLGLMARNIYKRNFKKVKFVLYNSYAETGFGHGTDKGLLAGILGYNVDDKRIKDIFDNVQNVEYSYDYVQDISRHPNSVDIIIDDKMVIVGNSVGAGNIIVSAIDEFPTKISGKYDTLVIFYKDIPGMISKVCKIIQNQNINIASLSCERSSKGGKASMCFELDADIEQSMVGEIEKLDNVFFATSIGKLK